jgi:FtsZ-binding cell division protein ZapB
MKALEILKADRDFCQSINNDKSVMTQYDVAIKEIEDLTNENKSLAKTLEKYNEEMIELRKENQDLKNSNNELLEGLKSTQKRLEEWLEKCK